MIRGVVWDRLHLPALLQIYGTAGERWRMRAQPEYRLLRGDHVKGDAPLQYVSTLS